MISKEATSQPDRNKISSIIEEKLIQASPDTQTTFPPVLRRGRVLSAIISEPAYLMVVFLTAEEERRFTKCINKQIDPLIGLIATGAEKAVFRAEKVKCATVRSCTVTNSFGFSLGPDCTVLLEDYRQIVTQTDIGTISYTIPLAYILSYGDEIDHATVYKHLEGLIVYSRNLWIESQLTNRERGTTFRNGLSLLQRTRN